MLFSRKAILACLSAILVSSQVQLNASQSESFSISIEDCQRFPSDWSLAPEEIYYALKYSTYEGIFQVLEFGAGEGTVYLSELLQKLKVPYQYNTFENSPSFIFSIPGVIFHYYFLPPVAWNQLSEWRPIIQSLTLPNLPTADLVIIDGPHGVSRADWYAKFKHLTRLGTIILIDDFHHYSEFGQELDKNFTYETIIEYNCMDAPSSCVNNGLERIHGTVHKCFKIVRIIQTK